VSTIRLGRLGEWRRPDKAARTRLRSVTKRVACAVVACAAAVTLAKQVHAEVHLAKWYTSPGWTSEFTRYYQLEECEYHAIRSAVPEGAAIYVASPDHARAQRLAELSIPWAVPQQNLNHADWALVVSDANVADYRHYLHHRRYSYMTYRYCPDALLSVKNLVQARQFTVPTVARHDRKPPRVGHL
jgi:hypothetical protein